MTDPNAPKIIVDEDWKTQVQAEKARAKSGSADHDPPASDATQPAPVVDQDADDHLPPPTFELLITSLATQTMMALGQMPDPFTRQLGIKLDVAHHHLEMLSMLSEKTRGNLTQAENDLMEAALHQLRLLFVQVKAQHCR